MSKLDDYVADLTLADLREMAKGFLSVACEMGKNPERVYETTWDRSDKLRVIESTVAEHLDYDLGLYIENEDAEYCNAWREIFELPKLDEDGYEIEG